MFGNNPYAQGGWYNPQNPYSINGGPRAKSSLAPTFGALPPLHNKPASVLEFELTHFNPDLFNCVIIGPQQRKFFEVKTSNSTTVISKPGDTFALIKWAQHPTVEARGVLSFQRTGEFLKLSSDSTYVFPFFCNVLQSERIFFRYRTMMVSGKVYNWVPRASGIYVSINTTITHVLSRR